jgi:hypothetical protein
LRCFFDVKLALGTSRARNIAKTNVWLLDAVVAKEEFPPEQDPEHVRVFRWP